MDNYKISMNILDFEISRFSPMSPFSRTAPFCRFWMSGWGCDVRRTFPRGNTCRFCFVMPLKDFNARRIHTNPWPPEPSHGKIRYLQKNAFFTLVKKGLALGSSGCLLVTMIKMSQYTGKWLLLSPYWSHPRPHKIGKRDD